MEKQRWPEEYRTGNAEIDGQHRLLFELLDELHQSVCGGDGDALVGAVLEELVAYTREHFYVEEELMRELCYPDLEQHQAEHQALLADVQSRISAFERGEKVPGIELLELLQQWFSGHVMTSDRRMAEFCQDGSS